MFSDYPHNFYSYVGNNPIFFTDPLGLFACPLPDCRSKIQERIAKVNEYIANPKARAQIATKTNALGITTCDNKQYPTVWLPKDLDPCLKDSVIVHELVHVQQCRELGPKGFNLGGLFFRSGMELPAYKAELKNLEDQLKKLGE